MRFSSPRDAVASLRMFVGGVDTGAVRADRFHRDYVVRGASPAGVTGSGPYTVDFFLSEPFTGQEPPGVTWQAPGSTGAQPSGDGLSLSAVYACPGDYTATASVPTSGGVQTESATVKVTDGAGLAISMVADARRPGFPITFTADTGVLPAGTTYAWSFGDGSSATGTSVVHTYAAEGRVTVALTATKPATVPPSPCATVTRSLVLDVVEPTAWVPLPPMSAGFESRLSAAVAGYYVPQNGVTVPAGATLVVPAGVVVKGLTGNFGNGTLSVAGTLRVEGQPGLPAVLTAGADDTASGDLPAGDTSAAWGAVRVLAGGRVSVDRGEIRYAAQRAVEVAGTGTSVSVTNSVLRNFGDTAVHSLWPTALVVDGTTIVNGSNGVLVSSGTAFASAAVRRSTLSNLNGNGVQLIGNVMGDVYRTTFTAVSAEVSLDTWAAGGTKIAGSVVTDGAGFTMLGSGTYRAGVTRLTGDLPYVVSQNGQTVPAGATLVVAPGRVVKAQSGNFGNGQIRVAGVLRLEGADGAPAVLTSGADDSVGGDYTIGNTMPSWGGILVQAGGQVSVDRSEIRYAAQRAIEVGGAGATVSVANSVLRNFGDAGVYSQWPTTVTVDASTITTGGTGVSVASGTSPSTVTVRSTALSALTAAGVQLTGDVTGTLDQLTFTGVSTEVSLDTWAADMPITGSVVTDGAGHVQLGGGNYPSGVTRLAGDLPYVVVQAGQTVPAAAMVVVPAGTVVKGQSGNVGNGQIRVAGVLRLEGADGAPAVLTSGADDSVGGDYTIGNTMPTWGGILVQAGGQVSVDRSEIRYAVLRAIEVGGAGASVAVTNSVLRNFGDSGVYSQWPTTVTVDASTITTGGTGVSVASGTSPSTVTVRGSVMSGLNVGVQLSGDVAGTVDTVTFTAVSAEVALDPWSADAAVTGSLVTDGAGFVQLSAGTYPVGVTRLAADLTYVVAQSGQTVPAGATLIASSGTVVKGQSGNVGNGQIRVAGVLRLEGAAGAPAVLTSGADDSVGGDYAIGNTMPTWGGVLVQAGGQLSVDRSEIRYAVLRAIEVGGTGTSVSVTSSVLRNAGDAAVASTYTGGTVTVVDTDLTAVPIGVDVGADTVASVHRSRFTGVTTGVRGAGTVPVDARENWWSSPLGTRATGGTVATTGLVDVRPWCLDAACVGMLDIVPPRVDGTVTPLANAAAWWSTPVSVTWSAIDPAPSSGLATQPASSSLATEGRDQLVASAPSCDPAGNCATGGVLVSIDRTAPVVVLDAPVDGSIVDEADLVPPTCTASDALSGLDGGCSLMIDVTGTAVGTVTYRATAAAADLAGNVATVVRSYTVRMRAQPPAAPVLTALAPLDRGVSASFDPPASDGASAITAYTLTCRDPALAAAAANGPGSPLSLGGLVNGTTYRCSVTATNAVAEGPASDALDVLLPLRPPAAPEVISSAGFSSSAELKWAPADSSGTPVTGYTARCTLGNVTRSAAVAGTATRALVTGLTNGSEYRCTVTAANVAGAGPASTPRAVTPLAVPGAPTLATPVAQAGAAQLTFTASTLNATGLVAFEAVCTTPGGPGGLTTGATSPLVVTGLANGAAYTCTVRAMNALGWGPPSTARAVTPRTVPDAPASIAVVPGAALATLRWTAPTWNGGAAVSGYTATCTDGVTPRSVSVGATVLTVDVTRLVNGTAYTCSVAARNVAGTGAAAAAPAVTPVTVPGAPRSVVGTAGDARATLAFVEPASNGGTPVLGYEARCTASGQADGVTSGPVGPLVVTGLANGVAYACTVRAMNAVGWGVASAVRTVTPRTVPDAPTSFAVTPGAASAVLAWSPPAWNGGAAVSGYTATCTAGAMVRTVSLGATVLTTTITRLTNGVTYACTVAARNVAGTGVVAGPVAVTPRP